MWRRQNAITIKFHLKLIIFSQNPAKFNVTLNSAFQTKLTARRTLNLVPLPTDQMTSPVSLPLFSIIPSNVGATVTHEISLLSLNSRWSSFYREESRSRAARLEPCTRCVGREKEACRSGKHAARNKRLDGRRVASRRYEPRESRW